MKYIYNIWHFEKILKDYNIWI